MTMADHERFRWIDETLVRSAIADPDDVGEIWNDLPADFDLDELREPERLRLLPAIGAGLARSDPGHPDVPRLRRMADENQVRQQEHATRWREVLAVLEGIPVWFTGGLALARASWAYAGDLSVRWPDDTRLVVRPDDVEQAIGRLSEAGWEFPAPGRLRRRLRWFESVSMRSPDDDWSELWWQPSRFVTGATDWDDGGEEIDVAGIGARTLSAEVALARICLDARLDWRRMGISWMLDVERILGSGDGLGRSAARIADEAGLGEVFRVAMMIVSQARTGSGAWTYAYTFESTRGDQFRSDFEAFGHGLTTPGLVRGLPAFLADRWGAQPASSRPLT